jgi:hypothetical protein
MANDNDYTFFCILDIPNLDYSFKVDIGRGKLVGDLKGLISEKRRKDLGEIAHESIRLWKVHDSFYN